MKKFFKSKNREGKLIELKELIEGNIARLYENRKFNTGTLGSFLQMGLFKPQSHDLFASIIGDTLIKEIESSGKVFVFFWIDEYNEKGCKMNVVIQNVSSIVNDWGEYLCGNEGKTHDALCISFIFNEDWKNCHHFLIAELPNRSR